MRRLAVLALLASLLACFATPTMATVINHCVSSAGTPVFTDQPCASLGALPAGSDATAKPGTPHRGPRFCARNLDALKKRVTAAFANHDVNALAGLIVWRDYREPGAVRILRQLSAIVQQPLLGFTKPPESSDLAPWPPIPMGAPPPPAPPDAADADTLRANLANGPPSVVTFPLVHRDGCLWLEPTEIAP